MELEELVKQLPEHWEFWTAEESKDVWWDDGRDYDKPVFVRKDGLARVYFNIDPTIFSIAFDHHSDGDARASFKEAIKWADWYVEKFPLEYHLCALCQDKAIWYYEPIEHNSYYCAEHVPRGCSCNIHPDGIEKLENVNGILKPLPCCEYVYNKYGYVK